MRTVVDLPDCTDQQRTRDGDRLLLPMTCEPSELIIQTVFTADKRRFPLNRQIVACDGGSDQRAECFRSLGIAPTEIIENREPLGVCSNCNRITDRFVDGGSGHMVRVVIAKAWVHAARQHDPSFAMELWPDDGRIAGTA